MSDESAMNDSDSFRPRCLSSSVPFEPKRCGVRGYLMKSSRVAPITREIGVDLLDHSVVAAASDTQRLSKSLALICAIQFWLMTFKWDSRELLSRSVRWTAPGNSQSL